MAVRCHYPHVPANAEPGPTNQLDPPLRPTVVSVTPILSALPSDTAELAVRELLRPGAIRVSSQPLLRLSDRAVLAYEVRWRMLRLDVLPSVTDVWLAAEAADLVNVLDDNLLQCELEAARALSPAPVLLGFHAWRRRRSGILPLLVRRVRGLGLEPSQLVWQLGDGDSELGSSPMAQLAQDLRQRGFRVAVPHFGVSRLRLDLLVRIRPDLMQLDHMLLEGVVEDEGLQAVVKALADMSSQLGMAVSATGVSSATEARTLMELGVTYGTGPALAEPEVTAGPGAIQVTPLSNPLVRDWAAAPGPAAAKPRAKPKPVAAPKQSMGTASLAEALSQTARALQAEHDPNTILELTADYLMRVIPADGIAVYAADWDTGQFRPVYAYSQLEPSYIKGVMSHLFTLDKGLTGWAFDLGTPQRVNDADAHPASIHIPGTEPEDESMLLIPMVAGDYRLGMLNVVRFRRDAFTADDLTAAALLAHMAAAAWRNAQLYSEQVHHATTDSLTGLLNSRWLRNTARRELALAERSGKPLAVLMMDLDKFKAINDSAGHAAGDVILRQVGKVLQRVIRAQDAAVRYGGEEFVVLLPDSGVSGGFRIAGEVQRGLSEISVPPQCSLSEITASIGIAVFPKHGRTLSQLLGAADAAMYTAKRNGGNRTKVA